MLFLIALVIPGAAQNQTSEHLFTVYEIEIYETASSVTEARRRGLAKAEEQGFNALIRRLVREEDLFKFLIPEGAKASDFVLGVAYFQLHQFSDNHSRPFDGYGDLHSFRRHH